MLIIITEPTVVQTWKALLNLNEIRFAFFFSNFLVLDKLCTTLFTDRGVPTLLCFAEFWIPES